MFNKLRNRFLLMNMVIISIIMLVAFASIYFITYRSVRSDIDMEMHRVSDFYRKGMAAGDRPQQNGGPHSGDFRFDDGPPPERSVSFALQTDGSWKITSVNSRFDMESDYYEQAKQKAAASGATQGQFGLGDTEWAFSVEKNGAGYSLVYLDVTAQQNILINLIYTFALVGLVMLAVIYATSRYFAGRSIAPVKDAFDKQKRFIADASHELKTPLAVIQTNADVLLANSDDTIAAQAKWLHHIKSETERMKTLTNDLLYLTEMDDMREETLHVPFDVSEAVLGVILTMEAVIFEKDISLDYDIEPGLTALGSSEQIKQVCMILLDNAIKYTNPKGAIAVTLKRQHGHVALAVTNTGEGITPDHLDKIFDRFYRADASRSRRQGGYGLGLAIAKSIVERHKGRIAAKSAPGKETTFTVQLPGAA